MTLSAMQQDVLYKIVIEEYSKPEVAAMYNVSIGVIRHAKEKALGTIREHLQHG